MDRHDRTILNSFATECFRNIADADYISARANYKLGLIHQFQWSALQAIEKYMKAILLYNQKKTKNLSHDLEKSLRRVQAIETFELQLNKTHLEFISHLNRNAQNRHLEKPTYAKGNELLLLDDTVWSLRRYCQVMDYDLPVMVGGVKNMQENELSKVHSDYYNKNPHKFKIFGGCLEKILDRSINDELRKTLIWKNLKYGKNRKNSVRNFSLKGVSHKPPHYRDVDKFELLSQFVSFSKNTRNFFK